MDLINTTDDPWKIKGVPLPKADKPAVVSHGILSTCERYGLVVEARQPFIANLPKDAQGVLLPCLVDMEVFRLLAIHQVPGYMNVFTPGTYSVPAYEVLKLLAHYE